jgi:hypothetical protein
MYHARVSACSKSVCSRVHSTSGRAADEYSSTVGVPLWLGLVLAAAVTTGLIGFYYFWNRRHRTRPPAAAERERNLQLSLLDTNSPHQSQVPPSPGTAPPPYTEREHGPEFASHQESLLYKTKAAPNLKI